MTEATVTQALEPCPNPWCKSTMIIRLSALDDESGQVCGEMRACAVCGLAGPAGNDADAAIEQWNAPARTAASQASDAGGWLPMDTAPTDGTEVIVRIREKVIRLGWYFKPSSRTEGWCDENGNSIEPIAWMPMPLATLTAPPTSDAGETFDKDWCINMARKEAGYEIGAGVLAMDPFTPSPPTSGERMLREALPADVVRLVIAARDIAFNDWDGDSEEWEAARKELDQASEAFASRVPWEDE